MEQARSSQGSGSQDSGSQGARPLHLCFGGTFDPVHNGHLRVLWESARALSAELVRLIPCHIPPLKDMPESAPAARLAMLRLALRDQPTWQIDGRELERTEPSYTFDTLLELRRELGREVSLVWLLGMDSFVSLHRWHRWQELTDHAHLLVVGRPGSALPTAGPVAEWAQQRYCALEQLHRQPAGGVAQLDTVLQDIASSSLRAAVRSGLPPRYLVPDAVCGFIVEHQLYRDPSDR